MAPRYAVYAVSPAGSSLEAAAAAWLGRCPRPDAPPPPGNAIDAARPVAAPRRYGFHGTLRAPMALADGTDLSAVDEAVANLAARSRPFDVTLTLGNLDGFLALTPVDRQESLRTLHEAVLMATEPMRRPLSDADRARRLSAPLTERQRHNLDRWGYPYVMDDFRFHMTLTERLPTSERAAVEADLLRRFAPVLDHPLRVDCLALFHEPEPGADFTEIRRHTFPGDAA